MNNQITYANKVAINQNSNIPDINKVNASDMNEIKSIVNGTINGSIPMGDVVVDSIRSKNMFDRFTLPTVNYAGTITTLSTGKRLYTSSSTNNQWAAFKLPNKLLGKTITISSTITTSSSNQAAIRMFYGTDSNPAIQSTGIEMNTTGSVSLTLLSTMPSGCDSIYLLLYANRSGTTIANDYVDYTNLMIEEGSTKTTYTPFQELDGCSEANGTATRNSSFTSGSCSYYKIGKFVIFQIADLYGNSADYTGQIFTGLPSPSQAQIILLYSYSTFSEVRVSVIPGGIIQTHYSTIPTSSASKQYYGIGIYKTDN